VPRSGWSSWRILLPSGIMVSHVPTQERLRGWLCGSFPSGHRPYAGSRVQLTEGRRVHSSGHDDVLSSRVPTTPGMVLQHAGWLHRADGDGGDALHWPDVTTSSRVGAGWGSVPLSRVLLSSFEGVARRPYGRGWYSVTELTLALLHRVVQWRG
jgi:hypothetical protein